MFFLVGWQFTKTNYIIFLESTKLTNLFQFAGSLETKPQNMTTQPRLVNKQFNSPIGLYSQQNIDEVLQREQQLLANGAVG